MASAEHPAVRIGAVTYLNSKPLIHGLDRLGPETELVLDYPSRLAEALAAGNLDVALIPSVEVLRHGEYQIISDACVSACGPALSVKLYSQVPPAEIRSLALDEGSRSSAALSRVLLAERYGVTPEIHPFPLGQSIENTKTDAVLLIGDRAIHSPDVEFHTTWDLGAEWLNWTGLPFVFAVWAARRDADLGLVEERLNRARDEGIDHLKEIACREAALLEIPEQTAIDYLQQNLHFHLGSAERRGLELFQRFCLQQRLIPEGIELVFSNCCTT